MNILFDEKTGEIYDFIASLYVIMNYEELVKEDDSKYIKTAQNIKYEKIFNGEKYSYEKVKLYFPNDDIFFKLVNISEIYNNPNRYSIEEFIKSLLNIEEKQILKKISKTLTIEKDIELSLNNLIKLLKDTDISIDAKWLLSCIINDSNKSLAEFCAILLQYNKKYPSLFKKEKAQLDKFTKEQKKLVEKNNESYVLKILENFLSKEFISNIKEVIVTTSFTQEIVINIEEKNKVVLCIGVNYKETMVNRHSTEKHMLVLKNISDETRYKIIKLLLEKDYYGQELSKILKITTATVSYHMNYLLLAGIVSVTKKEQKIYYSLNKESLKGTLIFLHKEFKLDDC